MIDSASMSSVVSTNFIKSETLHILWIESQWINIIAFLPWLSVPFVVAHVSVFPIEKYGIAMHKHIDASKCGKINRIMIINLWNHSLSWTCRLRSCTFNVHKDVACDSTLYGRRLALYHWLAGSPLSFFFSCSDIHMLCSGISNLWHLVFAQFVHEQITDNDNRHNTALNEQWTNRKSINKCDAF